MNDYAGRYNSIISRRIKLYIAQDPFASIKLIAIELQRRGYGLRSFMLCGKSFSEFTAPNGNKWLTRDAHISYPGVSSLHDEISSMKPYGYEFAAMNKVRTPITKVIGNGEGFSVQEFNDILTFSGKAIVKPAKASLSHGLTLGINSYEELPQAIAHAAKYSPDVIVQEQVDGEEVRFIYIGGNVVAAMLRRTPRVIGDGRLTTEQLLVKENSERMELSLEYVNYPQLDGSVINVNHHDLHRVPAPDEIVQLGKGTMIKTGASIYEILGEIHASYISEVKRLCDQLGAGVIVADFFIKDFMQPLENDNYCFIEFNTSPVLKLCYGCRDGKQYDIVPVLCDYIERQLTSNGETAH